MNEEEARMEPRVVLVKRISEGLVLLDYSDPVFRIDDRALWSRVKLRKSSTCPVSGRALASGEYAYAPVGNQVYRGHRLAPELFDPKEAS